MRVSRLLVPLLPLMAAILPANASNDTSPSLIQQGPEAEPVFVDGSKESAAIVSLHNDRATLLSINKSDTAIAVTASPSRNSLKKGSTQHKRSDSNPKPKKKKPPKNKSNNTNSTGEEEDDDSGVGRGITLPISLAISLVLLVGALQI
ncbi:hypothetical protein F4782DRAFT_516028 [Xylaria castorea]|nr:hypothetical protein F4782DRAFT_516028 [Xylaria castorea]